MSIHIIRIDRHDAQVGIGVVPAETDQPVIDVLDKGGNGCR